MKSDLSLKYYKPYSVIILIVMVTILYSLLSPAISGLLQGIGINYIYFPTTTALIVLLFGLLNNYLQKFPFLWKLLIRVPYIHGNYSGKVSWKKYDKDYFKQCSLKIIQTTSKIKVDCTFWDIGEEDTNPLSSKTHSESLVEDFILNENHNYELHFYYRNTGSIDSKIPIREGYNILKYNPDNNEFEGQYFSKNSKSDGNAGLLKVSLDKTE